MYVLSDSKVHTCLRFHIYATYYTVSPKKVVHQTQCDNTVTQCIYSWRIPLWNTCQKI